jgi:hypothetical protein
VCVYVSACGELARISTVYPSGYFMRFLFYQLQFMKRKMDDRFTVNYYLLQISVELMEVCFKVQSLNSA